MSQAPILHPITGNQRKEAYAAAEIFQNQRKETHAATDAFRDARANQLGRTDLLQQGLVRGEHSAVAGAASATDGSHRGVKRPQADTPDEIIDDRDLWRMRDNSVRLRGLLTNIEGNLFRFNLLEHDHNFYLRNTTPELQYSFAEPTGLH